MPRVIVIANQKGGVGKTTTVANLGAALAELGKITLLVDLDPQGALTAAFGLDPSALTRTTYTVIMRDNASLASMVRLVAPRLLLLPASVDLAAAEYQTAEHANRTHRLKHALEKSRVPADIVLIDTPPNVGFLTVNGMVAATELLIPVQCQYLSMRGVRALLDAVWLIHERLNPDLNLLGVLATMYKKDSAHAREVVAELRSVFDDKLFETVIDDEEDVARAPVAKTSVLAYSPQSQGAAAFRQLAREIINAQ